VSRRAFGHSALQVRTTGRKSCERYTHQHFHYRCVLIVAVGAIVAWVVMRQRTIARDERGEADTEELREAVVHYRTFFDELLEVKPTSTAHTSADPVPVHS
jgi:hypothetical protein